MPPEAPAEILHQVHNAFRADDAPAVRRLLDQYPELKARINDPSGEFDSPAIARVRSKAMLDVLLDAGADINGRSKWWAGGFGLLDSADPVLATYAIERGAIPTVHSAARLGLTDKLRALIGGDPALVHARGGDGQMPLHFASTVEIAEYLLQYGAEIDARDIDHESTAAQYMVADRPEIARFLIGRGCTTDILMASAVGDIDLVRRHLDADPDSIRMRVSDDHFPMIGPGRGGTIYQWKLGWYVSAVQVAKSFGHGEIFDFLMESSPADEKLLNACWLHDEAMVRSLLAQHPDLAARLTPAGRRQLAHAARNNDTAAARMMLEAGLPVDTYTQHHATPLHWAAWHGNAELVRLILGRNPPLDDTTSEFQGTPVNWAVHGSENGWDRTKSDYAATLEVLLDAGAPLPKQIGGAEAVQAVLRRHGAGLL
jgi:ankyrin repeat protein